MKGRFIPASLFGRLLMALLATIGVSLLIVVALLLNERRAILSPGRELAFKVDLIMSTVDMLADLDDEQRAAQIARRGTITIYSAGWFRDGVRATEDAAVAAGTLQARLTEALGDGYIVAVTPAPPGPPDRSGAGGPPPGEARRDRGFGPGEGPGGPGPRPPNGDPRRELRTRPGPPGPGAFGLPELDVTITLAAGDVVRFRTDVPRSPPALPVAVLAQLALVTLVLGAVLYVMARTITRPLADLASAAEIVGRGGHHLPLRESGARELREATRAFNTMQERLNRYLDSRTRVVAAMSHDLRTPLTRLKLRTESLDDAALRERFNADVDEMERMVTGALNLFRGMNQDEPLQSVDVAALVAELKGELAEVGTPLAVRGAAAPVVARRSALKRCLTNLLSNAAKYGTNLALEIEDGPAELVLRVLDEGPGIPPEMLEQVFEPFFRLERSRSSDTGGVGLGLCIARDIAQGHGGSVTLRNRSPHGLEATLRLPRTTAAAAP